IPAAMAYGDTALLSVSIPPSVTSIGNEAFRNCSSLKSAVINASIGHYAFDGCTSLASVELRYQVESIGGYAFRDCYALKSLTIPCSAKSVGSNFIQGCTGLTALTFDGAPGELTSGILYIGPSSSLASLRINLGVTKLGANMLSNGGYGHPNLTSITLPEALREVGQSALNGAPVEFLKVYDLGMLGTGFAKNLTTLKEIEFERGVISDYAFYGCTNLEKVTMGAGVFAIGQYAFYGCAALKEVTFSNTLTSIGAYAFNGCAALEEVSCQDSSLKTIGSYAFYNCTTLRQIDMGSVLKSVGSYAFSGCTALEAALFPPTVESYGTYVLNGCASIKTLSIGGPSMPVLGNTNWLGVANASQLETLIVGEGVTEIGFRAFANTSENYSLGTGRGGYRNLKQVTLPSTLKKIGAQAFGDAASLETIALPSGLESIGDYAFYNCTALTSVSYSGSSLASIGQYAFQSCKALKTIGLGDGLVSVGNRAFEDCIALEAAIFPPTMQEFGSYVLNGC
ncbi:MAG: leucine-rich repeat domain-containing protein, partial [Clostridia bacterium]|nr:leucine-rich repeat domain-containing protein [Clostridia bacterium]